MKVRKTSNTLDDDKQTINLWDEEEENSTELNQKVGSLKNHKDWKSLANLTK